MNSDSDIKMVDYSKKKKNRDNLTCVYKKIENIAKLKLGFTWQNKPKITQKQSQPEEKEII